jgi:hypothetical protein
MGHDYRPVQPLKFGVCGDMVLVGMGVENQPHRQPLHGVKEFPNRVGAARVHHDTTYPVAGRKVASPSKKGAGKMKFRHGPYLLYVDHGSTLWVDVS